MMLGRYLARGLGGERNLEEARVWLEKAKAQGLRDAEVDLASLPPPPATAAAPGYAAQMDAGSS